MPGRRLILVLSVVFAGVAASGCAEQTAAARVGNDTLSERDLLDEAEALLENDALWEQQGQDPSAFRGEAPGSYSQEFIGQILDQRVQLMLLDRLIADQDLEVGDADRALARQQLQSNLGEAFDAFPESYQDQLVDDSAVLAALEQLDSAQLGEDFEEIVQSTEVVISSRYGSWDAEAFLEEGRGVLPPPGPVTPEDSDEESDDTAPSDDR